VVIGIVLGDVAGVQPTVGADGLHGRHRVVDITLHNLGEGTKICNLNSFKVPREQNYKMFKGPEPF
jgi:hypothetical protein